MSLRAFLILCLFAAGAAALIVASPVPGQAPSPIGDVTLRLTTSDGRIGSAVHINNGFAITAAHVVTGIKTIRARTSLDTDQIDATVLWANDDYDVALIQLSRIPTIPRAPVTCRAAQRGEPVKAYGNPIGLPFFESSGQISIAIPAEVDRWKSVIVVSVPGGVGMSGGPVLDTQGHVLGIIVGSAGQIAPILLAVPVTVVCTLLGRTPKK